MIKADIVKRLSDGLKLQEKDALVVVDTILDIMRKIIAEQGRLEIRDFGVFQTKVRKPRIGRNPKNKVEYPIPPRRVVTFKMCKEVKLARLQNPPSPTESEEANN